MEFRIQYMRLVCIHYFPVLVIEQSLGCVHVCFLAFVCVSSLHNSCSDIRKLWIVPNPCGCLPQHIQTLTPTPGIHFINIPPLILLGLWYSAVGYPHVQILPLFHLASNCPNRAALFHAWMPSSPCLASDFLHKSASSKWIYASLDVGI